MEELMVIVLIVLQMTVIGAMSVCTLFGIYRAFQKSVLLGLLCLIVPLSFTIIGAWEFIFKEKLLNRLNK